jgi:hypothetical protein
MPQDECRDCEGFFPQGLGLTQGLCTKCRPARRKAKLGTNAEVPPGKDVEPETNPD